MRFLVIVAFASSCTLKSEGVSEIDAGASVTIDAAGDPGSDAGADAAIALTDCGLIDSVICEDFEGDLSAWTQQTAGGDLEIVTDPVFRGGGALKVTTPTAGANGYLFQDITPITAGSIYTRAYYYLPSDLITPGLVELTNTGDSSGIHFHFSVDTNAPILIINNQTSSGPDVPRDTWFCMEMRVDIGAAGGGEMFINEVSAAVLSGLDTDLAGGYGRLEVGIYDTSPAAGGFEIYIDEVALSTTPIGCADPT